jgi:folate-dependent phosphoribosylglycinamide formyltransferase PurN
MRLAIVTNEAPHHQFFVSQLAVHFDVKLVLHPQGQSNINDLVRKIGFYGLGYSLLKVASLVYNAIWPGSFMRRMKKREKQYFSDRCKGYHELPDAIVHRINTVNSPEAIRLVKEAGIDVICFLGGDLGKMEFIRSARLCSLNYHSGISPFYNGHKTTFHAVKDGRPNFCGGTLMYINEQIDGGDILSHHFTGIEPDDDSVDLFFKGIEGAVELYLHFLYHILQQGLPFGVSQTRAVKFTRNIDWTIADDWRLRWFEKSGRMQIYQRHSINRFYYNLLKHDINKVCVSVVDATLHKHPQITIYS